VLRQESDDREATPSPIKSSASPRLSGSLTVRRAIHFRRSLFQRTPGAPDRGRARFRRPTIARAADYRPRAAAAACPVIVLAMSSSTLSVKMRVVRGPCLMTL
jgi:hypothetical protein